jgi:hypothetical protein
MRKSPVPRLIGALVFALLAGLLVATWNPVDHAEAQLRADTHGIKRSLALAADKLAAIVRRA